MSVLFKTPDNIVRKINVLNPATNESNEVEYSGSYQPSVNKIPLVFGKQWVQPVPIYHIDGPETNYGVPNGTKTKMVFYAISANSNLLNQDLVKDNSGINSVYIDGKRVEGLVTISPTTNKQISGVDWKSGITSQTDGAIGAPLKSNFGGDRVVFGSNMYMAFVKAGSDFTKHNFYKMFTGQLGIIPKYNIIKDYPDNRDFDMLVIFYKFNSVYFSNDNPKVELIYRRGAATYASKNTDVGNCITEILRNPRWGMGLVPDVDYVANDFRNRGGHMAGVFYIDEKPLIETIKIINEEQTENQIYEEGGKLRYGPTNATGLAITDDNIIGDLEIQYPDQAVVPTKLIATYTSYSFGTREIEIGTDDTNVVRTEIRTTNNSKNAKKIAQRIFESLNNTITLTFKGDRSLHQFSIRDQVTLSTEVFSGTITIIEMIMNSDYTFNITAEADIGTTAPEANLRGKTPVIQIGDGFYRPPDVEPNPEDDDDEEIIVPKPVPPDPNRINITGLNHPYNRVTGLDNIDWYVGGTLNGYDVDPAYDANGIRTRFVQRGQGAVFSTDYSLIWRDLSKEGPSAIEMVYDIAIGNEQRNQMVGWASADFRVQYPQFFNDRMQNARYNSGTSWREVPNPWPGVWNQRPVYPGGQDPIVQQQNTYDYQYQTGDIPDNSRIAPLRRLLIIPNNNVYRPDAGSLRGITWVRDDMERNQLYRLHFTAIYGNVFSPDRVEYIGTTTTYGDERSVLAADTSEAKETAQRLGQIFTPNTQTPPSRSA